MLNQSIHLLSLVSKERLDEILRGFTEVAGVASVITDPNGRPLTESHNFTLFCRKYCRSTEAGRERCYESDSYGGSKALELKEPFVYRCLNSGLLDGGVPIIVDGYHLANFVCGQVKEEPIPKDEALERARAIGITDFDGYLAALENVPLMSKARLLSIVDFMAVITRSISEQALHKYLLDKQSKRYLNKLINSVSDCIMSTNYELKISMINEAGSKMFGVNNKQLPGVSLFQFLADDASKQALEAFKKTSHSGGQKIQLTARKDQQRFPISLALSRINSNGGGPSDYVAVVRDISAEKKVEKMKEDLVGMLTHDLGTPALSIKNAMQLLLDQMAGPLNGGQQEIIEMALNTSRQLHDMVVNFLDIYRNENGQFLLHRQDFDINRTIQEVIDQLRLFAREKRIVIHFSSRYGPSRYFGDRNRLKRTLANIVDNAIKYSLEDSAIKVCLKHLPDLDDATAKLFPASMAERINRTRGYLVAKVTDQGYGIPEDIQPTVFEKFFSLGPGDSDSRRGLGLGLNFCKLVVEAHGGIICARTPFEVNRGKKTPGCQFVLALPCQD